MNHQIVLAIWLVLIAMCLFRGLLGYVRYARRRVFQAVDSDYRAAALVANAKRDARILRQREKDRIVESDYLDPYIVAAELRAERLSDATMCEAEWSR
ncbi:hypothetical protein [Xanthomonas nasturtii]|uniref:DUF4051 domain-containing protein n=1 Tax=Xanthomonas nasturtii TaxID=1843581 RepID=A0ABT0LR89_9XANT|nr:hypothetical protein [Xanthomonas nasturtii]MCL1551657.1 hypothetical protein [Xanthomonas nasturtii]MCL1556003.1 hypothetical protein [Xanthomonas nasturtii]